ncbi:hypothetical protein LAG90_03590 [Marinilongibacter aquaticus]|uniref:hypothetical protein n=1 Tax=Marinilongibacter aquaticus TaxID=2975157 RepID=UPI0021BD06C3|nr:hypothetical protein [Marinilongibacter aquaticus]UBM59732.1 hypothetical protein LAG90_03590 [Marinilongibacter aquaticus]
MQFREEAKEQYMLLTETNAAEGQKLQVLIGKQIEGEGFRDFVLQAKTVPNEEDIVAVEKQIEESGGILIVVAELNAKPIVEKWGFDHIVFLPTVHEAEEAIMMHELERQFKEELGE